MKLLDTEANQIYNTIDIIKNQQQIEFETWYMLDEIQQKLSATHKSVQGLIKKMTEAQPGLTERGLLKKLEEALEGKSKNYSITLIPFEMLRGVKGHYNILKPIIELPEKPEQEKPNKK